MLVTAKIDFPFSRDGVRIERVEKGQPVDIPDDLLPGLHAAGNIALPGEDVVGGDATTAVTGDVQFNKDTATVEELRAYLTAKGIQFHHKAGVDKLRALVP